MGLLVTNPFFAPLLGFANIILQTVYFFISNLCNHRVLRFSPKSSNYFFAFFSVYHLILVIKHSKFRNSVLVDKIPPIIFFIYRDVFFSRIFGCSLWGGFNSSLSGGLSRSSFGLPRYIHKCRKFTNRCVYCSVFFACKRFLYGI